MKFQFAPLALVVFAAACGTSKSNVESDVSAASTKGKTLTQGSYLVTVSSPSACQPGELALTKKLTYSQSGVPMIKRITLVGKGSVKDNLLRPMVCLPGSILKGSILVETQATIKLDVENGKIESVKAIKIEAPKALVDNKIPAGKYVIDYERQDDCQAGSEFIPKKFYEFDSANTGLLQNIVLSFDGIVTDNLIRTAVCRPGAQTGRMYLSSSKAVELKLEDDIVVTKYSKVK